jgi:predicted N-acetyltransferase YhbS
MSLTSISLSSISTAAPVADTLSEANAAPSAAPFIIRAERPADDATIESLHEISFGPGRFARTAFRLREGVPHDRALAFVAMFGGRIGGSVRLTPITVGGRPAMILGPLVVHPDFKDQGAGKALIRHVLAAAKTNGVGAVILVGDRPYYGPLGFDPVPMNAITLPGPVDPARLLIANLDGSAWSGPARSIR